MHHSEAPCVGLQDGLPVGLIVRLDKDSPVIPTKTPHFFLIILPSIRTLLSYMADLLILLL